MSYHARADLNTKFLNFYFIQHHTFVLTCHAAAPGIELQKAPAIQQEAGAFDFLPVVGAHRFELWTR